MHNKVLLIRPKNIYGINNYPSLGLLMIATSLKYAGFEPIILSSTFGDLYGQIISHLRNTLLIGMTMMTSECPDAFRILKFLNGQSHIPIVVGGWHPTLFPEQMKRSLYVDYVIQGDGELDIVYLARSLVAGTRLPKLVPHRKPTELCGPLYEFDSHLIDYIDSPLTDMGVKHHGSLRWLPIETSRGCPSSCRFCSNAVVAGRHKWRARPARQVIEVMNHLSGWYFLNHIKIIDDNFFVNTQRALKIAEGVSDKPFTWDAECRADYLRNGRLDDAALKTLKRSGLTQLTLGIESGSQTSLDLMNKHLTLDQAEYAVQQCNKHGIYARCSFIIEVPGESTKDIEQTRKFVNRLRRYKHFTCGVQTFRPYPRCSLTKEMIDNGQWSEPKSFKEWTNQNTVEVFTKAQKQLPWQVQPKRSERIAAYQSIESVISLGQHNTQGLNRLKCRVFQFIAGIRNRTGLYFWSFDLWLYQRFVRRIHENHRHH